MGGVFMDNIQQEILERIVRIETKIDGYNRLREKLDTTFNKVNNNEVRVSKIEDGQIWLWRIFAGSLIASFVAAFLKWQ